MDSNLEYQKRIQKALTYIRENLDQSLALADVARVACFSPFHFHRIFRALMNETVGEYITRKRLEKAAIKLAYSSGSKVSDVAFEFGYASVSGFSKAFNQWFGFRPTEINKIRNHFDSDSGKLHSKYDKSINIDEMFVEPDQQQVCERLKEIENNLEIRSIDSFKLSYLTCPDGYSFTGIKQTWTRLKELLEDYGIALDSCERFSLSHDHPALTPEDKCRYDAGAVIPDSISADLKLSTTNIPSGRYAIYRVSGAEDSILGKYLEFFTIWMPQSGYEPDNFPILERYLSNCREGHLEVELWAKIKRLIPL